MATLNVVQYRLPIGRGMQWQVLNVPELASEPVTIGAEAALSEAFDDSCNCVELTTDTDCWVKFGLAPTAQAGDILLLAGQTRQWCPPIGVGWKVSVIEK